MCRKLRIWLHLLKKSLMKNFIFCPVLMAFVSNGVKKSAESFTSLGDFASVPLAFFISTFF